MWKSTHEAVRKENYTLRDVLRDANAELHRHRTLIASIKDGSVDIVRTLDKMAQRK